MCVFNLALQSKPTRLTRPELPSGHHIVKSNICFLLLALLDLWGVSDVGDYPLPIFFFRGQSHKIDLICPGGLCWIIFLCVPVKSWCCQGCDAYLSPILLRNLISSFPFNRHAYVDDAQHKTANLPQEVLLTALALIYWHQFSLLHVFALLFSPAPSQGSLRLAPTISSSSGRARVLSLMSCHQFCSLHSFYQENALYKLKLKKNYHPDKLSLNTWL